MSDEIRRLKMQQEATAAALQRMQMQVQAQGARRREEDDDDDDGDVPPAIQNPSYQQQFGQHQPPSGGNPYQQVDPNQIMLQAIANRAAAAATQQVQQNLNSNAEMESKIKTRMQRLVSDYPALTQEDSELVVKSREIYARIAHENPSIDEATRYELAVREAASLLGARPVNAPVEEFAASDYVMPAGRNYAVPTRATKSRLTPNIIANAKLMGISVDPNTPEGKKNLAELSEYSARFNADQDEAAYRYR